VAGEPAIAAGASQLHVVNMKSLVGKSSVAARKAPFRAGRSDRSRWRVAAVYGETPKCVRDRLDVTESHARMRREVHEMASSCLGNWACPGLVPDHGGRL
jgi:hypothetical protein